MISLHKYNLYLFPTFQMKLHDLTSMGKKETHIEEKYATNTHSGSGSN
jgi:hypothetical protein